jgi:hypothetical protein
MVENASLIILAICAAIVLWRLGRNLALLALAAFAVWYYFNH